MAANIREVGAKGKKIDFCAKIYWVVIVASIVATQIYMCLAKKSVLKQDHTEEEKSTNH